MGGTGSKQEDQIITESIQQRTGTKFTYISYRGGGEVAVQLVGKHVDSTVNNPIEAVAQWRGGMLRPLCVFDSKRMPYKEEMTKTMSWHDIPTCEESGLPVEYTMLRGIFMPGGVTQDQVDYYIGLLKKVRETPDWKDFMSKGAFNQTVMSGKQFSDWLGREEARHFQLMKTAGFIAHK
jgi:tripartite-type tricarboxylate transporter receptor subunit TctC